MKQSNHEYAQSWYPVFRSSDLKKGQHKAIKIFGKDWVLFRTLSGKVSFLTRHCCHMGADLCQGKVVNETIECPLHAWRFDVSGACVHIPDYTKQLPDRNIFHLNCEEKYGLILVFWGEKPLFPIPSPPDISGQQVFSQALTQTINTSHQVFSLNSFDTQHFSHVHNRRFVKPPDIYQINPYVLRIDFETKILRRRWLDYVMSLLQKGSFRISIESWGASILTLHNHVLKAYAFIALQPIESNLTKVYLVAIRAHDGKPSLFDKLSLSIAVHLIQGFLITDLKPTKNMSLHQMGLLDDLDNSTKIYWDHCQELPRFNIKHK